MGSESIAHEAEGRMGYRGIHADVIVYIFAHLHATLHTEENLVGVYWLQATKELVKLKTWLKF